MKVITLAVGLSLSLSILVAKANPKDDEWDPLVYNQSLANSLYLLVARAFDSPEKRIRNLRKRMEAIPTVIAQAQKNLQHPPRVYTETAIEQTQGAISLVREGLAPL